MAESSGAGRRHHARDLHQPHDRLFRKVFSEPAEAAGLLRAHVPSWLADMLDWSSLTLMNDSYVDDDLRASESDLLYAVEQRPGAAAPGDAPRSLRLYLLFEHQSRPDRWMRFRLLKYCCRIWDDFLRSDEAEETSDLPPIVPLVFYQGESCWRHATSSATCLRNRSRGGPGRRSSRTCWWTSRRPAWKRCGANHWAGWRSLR